MAKFRFMESFPETFTAKVVGATVAVGDALKYAAGGVSQAAAADTVNAFAIEGAAAGTYIKCGRGAVRVIGFAATGVDFALGDKVYLAASQALNTGAVGNKAVGDVVGSNPEVAGWVEVLFDPNELFTHA